MPRTSASIRMVASVSAIALALGATSVVAPAISHAQSESDGGSGGGQGNVGSGFNPGAGQGTPFDSLGGVDQGSLFSTDKGSQNGSVPQTSLEGSLPGSVDGSLPGSAAGSTTYGSSILNALETSNDGSSLSSEVPLSAVPWLGIAALAEGALGSFLYEGSGPLLGSAVDGGSSDPAPTFPDPNAGPGEYRGMRHIEGNVYQFDVYSPSMDKVISNDILLPMGPDDDTPRPTFYLMMGADGGTGGWSWYNASNYEEFFAGKNVNVVTPRGGKSSMQGDWYADDLALGTNKWATYMLKELPPVVDQIFHGTGRDAIAGISMSGGPSIELASQDPARFAVAGSYSGCPSTSGVLGQMFAYMSTLANGGNPINLWGWPWDSAWSAHSPVLNLDKLRNTPLYVSAAQGVPGYIDSPNPAERIGAAQPIEGLSYACSAYFANKAQAEGLDVTWSPKVEGTHSWGLFEAQLRESWDVIGPAIGVG